MRNNDLTTFMLKKTWLYSPFAQKKFERTTFRNAKNNRRKLRGELILPSKRVALIRSCPVDHLLLRGRAEVARQAHNLEAVGSIPTPATNDYYRLSVTDGLFFASFFRKMLPSNLIVFQTFLSLFWLELEPIFTPFREAKW